ncbi:Csi1p NDAI_0B01470 [Naumovozyma dairenensis CBS 421]|uniref:Uncharacterized protein n=1 Tax=Naumovozyma dairenensis (strain ATCC 10597 / BCRC 20456 / CBS 421 / NBRC 0211 / NRRL Y-12639) TaxID=1071378 RepID=G0W5X0_NAUDC|nr:hypothetical protein NDAI_0B01470 [Naumovozyma dairenensis CBS 421]CCD23181.1 hypothetical protein NDAI_0B01470 [Naumovozyma dairenensis CBS 421]
MLVVTLESHVLMDINYSYNLESLTNSTKQPGCHLLLGQEIATPACEEITIHVTRSVEVPLQLGVDDPYHFKIDIEQVQQRLNLINKIYDNVVVVGLMILNVEFYNYSNVIEELKSQPSLQSAKVIFHYEPTIKNIKVDHHQRNAVDAELILNCYLFDTGDRIGYILKQNVIDIVPSDIVVNNGIGISNYTFASSSSSRNKNPQATTLQDNDEEENNRDEIKLRKLIKMIDNMIHYLEMFENGEYIIKEKKGIKINDKILRRISILISDLQKSPTKDIEDEIMNKENEIRIIQIACEQWEMLNK